MAETKIEWCDRVLNPVTGCSPVSAGCDHCYAARMSKRLAGRCGYPKDDPFRVTLHPEKLDLPLKWRKPQKIFVNSMSDLFHEDVPFVFILRLWMAMAQSKQHTYLILTKRPERMKAFVNEWLPDAWKLTVGSLIPLNMPLLNVWLGVTVENQEQDWRIKYLLETMAAVRFVSVEPMLGAVKVPIAMCEKCKGLIYSDETECPNCGQPCLGIRLDWVICGPETGPGKRPMKSEWIRDLYRQCEDAEVPFFDKKNILGLDLKQFPEVSK